MRWVYVGLALLAFYLLSGIVIADDRVGDRVAKLACFGFLLSWYFGSAGAQAEYVKQRFGTSFERRPWARPLPAALGSLVAYLALSILVGVLVGIVWVVVDAA